MEPTTDERFSETDGAVAPRPVVRRAHILVVEDHDSSRRGLEKLLRADGYQVTTAEDGDTAMAEARRVLPDLVLTDLDMPGMHGRTLCQHLHELDRALPVVVMIAYSDIQIATDSLRAGAEDYLIKPLQYDAVLWHVERSLARREATRELAALQLAHNDRLVAGSLRDREHARVEARHRAEMSALLGNLQEGVVIADRGGDVVVVNAAAMGLLGVGRDTPRTAALLDSFVAPRMDAPPSAAHEPPLRRALRGDHFVDDEVSCTRGDGERRRLLATGTSVTNDANEVVLAIVVFRDVTDAVRHERQREEYLALLSHDLGNPLSNIVMCATLLRQSALARGSVADAQTADRAEQNVRRMTAMLDELREATSLESGGVALRTVPCDMRELMASVIDAMTPIDARRITLETDDACSYPILADTLRLERVLTNLLSNALKYSPAEAPVRVRIESITSAVRVAIVDRGIGIAPETIEKLFHRYFRATAAKARASGLGLGLYIARLIVEAHGGRIEVSSAVGVGSTFVLTLPASCTLDVVTTETEGGPSAQ